MTIRASHLPVAALTTNVHYHPNSLFPTPVAPVPPVGPTRGSFPLASFSLSLVVYYHYLYLITFLPQHWVFPAESRIGKLSRDPERHSVGVW